MKLALWLRSGLPVAVLALLLTVTGCSQKVPEGDGKPQASQASNDGHNHLGWWCTEHGIPEEQCSMCSSKAAAQCKEKGDWCEKHNRAQSQCFICEPSRAEKFVKLYEAKFGEKPPEPSQ